MLNLAAMKIPVTLSQLITEGSEHIHNPVNKQPFLLTGFKALDDLQTFKPGELVLIGARPGMGKVAFALDIALGFSKNAKTLYQSLDYSEQGTFNRIVGKSSLSTGSIYNERRALNPIELKTIDEYLDAIKENKLEVLGRGLYYSDTYFDEILELIIGKDYQAIVLDCSHFIDDSMRKANRKSTVKMLKSLNRLKAFCKERKVCLVITSQLNSNIDKRKDKRPYLSDLRIPGVELICDKIAFLYRPEYYGITEDEEGDDITGLTEFDLRFDNTGKSFRISLSFKSYAARFADFKQQFEPYL
jgi:replicative DNA helicase